MSDGGGGIELGDLAEHTSSKSTTSALGALWSHSWIREIVRCHMSALWDLWCWIRKIAICLKSALCALCCCCRGRETAGETGETAGDTGEPRALRRLYESVPRLSSAPCLLTFLQQKTTVPGLSILHPPHHPGFLSTFHIRTDHGHQSFHPRTCHRPPSCIS